VLAACVGAAGACDGDGFGVGLGFADGEADGDCDSGTAGRTDATGIAADDGVLA
jgi:hypothetical protein